MRSVEQEGPAFDQAHHVQNFASLAACFSLCVLVASAVFVRWQDMPMEYRWVAPDDEVAAVELISGNGFAGEWASYHTEFDCSRLNASQCARLQEFRSLVAHRDFQAAETRPSQEVVMDLSSSTLTVRLRSGKVVKRYIYDYTLNANYNLLADTVLRLAEEGLIEARQQKPGTD
ncbi:hypothetical protein [Duganella sp. Root1480D1]|uniref:hypothetical protein n=1 Tax=Duganella sp. Root1480D1 TaxID=1736471 RepID=UPI00070C2595|nr:hypothetical protein [Duganella sp. Root1480D1]